MNREIKFRGFHKEINEMEYYDTVAFLNFEEDVLCYQNSPENEPHGFSDTSDVELMQFTGIKDKNGVEIYEGDIIAQRIKNDEYLNIKEVKFGCFEDPVDYFNYDGVGFYAVGNDGEENGTIYYMAKFADYEVIGNIYENKELLEEVE